jgi:CII-binding regulator of phage lambda lysogenization HflD
LKSNAVQSLKDIEKLVIERNATVSLKDLGETEDSLKPALPVTEEFIHGSSKELTKLKIALLKLEKQELLLHSKPSMVELNFKFRLPRSHSKLQAD